MIDTPTPTPLAPVTVEPRTRIKLSEAIRLGCLVAPVQAFGWYGSGEGTACALEAAMLGGARNIHDSGRDGLTCPAGCDLAELEPSRRLISHLNDDHRWSRERIADWLAGMDL